MTGTQVSGGALAGVRVLELCHAIAGPHCTQMLADHGADVIKIEPPTGELSRMALPVDDGESIYFSSHNRGKRSVCVDLKTAQGLQVLFELVATADVLVTNYSKGVPERLGWAYDQLAERNPRLIMAHITGFGIAGNLSGAGAYDGIIQAMSGLPDLTGEAAGPPTFVGNFMADHLAAYHGVIAILLALTEREKTGRGEFVDLSMLDSYFGTLAHDVPEVLLGRPRQRHGNTVQTAFADVYPTVDGNIFIAPLGEPTWQRFVAVIDPAGEQERVSYDDATGPAKARWTGLVRAWIQSRTTAAVLAELEGVHVPCGRMQTITEAVQMMQEAGRDMLVTVSSPQQRRITVANNPIRNGRATGAQLRQVPVLGGHTETVLAEMGIDAERLAELLETGAVGPASAVSAPTPVGGR